MGDTKNKVVMETVIDIDLSYPATFEEEGSPLRPIFCLKNKLEMKDFEEREDCFILDFDPDDTIDLSNLSVSKGSKNADSTDISVIAEKGQVACRDFPHSRHSCAKYPFDKTTHESYCELCYCFVCDIAAPCKNWTGMSGHCHAINDEVWKAQRKLMQQLQKPNK